jgi:AcrR family transcriptional regulator
MDLSVRAQLLFPPYEGDDLGPLWEELGLSEAATRERILHLTMREVARVGPASFNTRTVCAQLGVTHPIIQYHFGSRDGLIAEAGHLVFVRYVDKQVAAVEAATRTPVDRLRACLTAGLRLSVEIRGWGAVLNYFPFYSSELAGIVAERFEEQHTAAYERSLAMLAQLVLDVLDDRVSDDALGDTTTTAAAGRAVRLADPATLDAITTLSFTMHGLSVWRAGHVSASTALASGGDAEAGLADRIAEMTIGSAIGRLVAARGSL